MILLFYFFLAFILTQTSGHYDAQSVVALTVASGLLVLGQRFRQINLLIARQLNLLLVIMILWFGWAMWSGPGVVYIASAQRLGWLKIGLGIQLIGLTLTLALSLINQPQIDRLCRVAFIVAVSLVLANQALTIIVSPKPFIDVFTLTTQASDYLWAGLNPYTQSYPDLYQGLSGYPPGTNYWPVYYYWSALFRLWGDIRVGAVVAQLVTTLLLLDLLKRFEVPPITRRLYVLGWLTFPVTLFVIEQAWIEPVIVMFIVLFVWAVLKEKWWLAGGVLGLMAGLKQHLPVFVLFTLIFVWRTQRPAFRQTFLWALITFVLVLTPFVVADPQAFFQQTVATYLQRGLRPDSLSIPAYWVNEFGWRLNNLALAVLSLLALGLGFLLLWRARSPGWGTWAHSLVIAYGGLFLFGKQAYCNYYYLLAFYVLIEIVFKSSVYAETDICS